MSKRGVADVKARALKPSRHQSAAEFFVLPSHQENFGAVVAESLAAGTPVLIAEKVNIWREGEAEGGGVINDDLQSVFEGLSKSVR